MRRALPALTAALLLSSLVLAVPAGAVADIPLGTASTFAVLGASSVTNTGPSVITGDLGVSPGTSISGFPPGSVTGTVHNADTTSTAAQGDIGTAYAAAAAQACDTDLSGQDLGGQTLPPAVYCFASSAQLTGVLRLDAQAESHGEVAVQGHQRPDHGQRRRCRAHQWRNPVHQPGQLADR